MPLLVPMTGAGIASIQFRAETDRDGRLAWRSAPKDAVRYNIGKADYMGMRSRVDGIRA